MYRLGKKYPAANYTQNKYSKREMVFQLLLIVGFHCDMVLKWMEIHQDMGERFKIKLTMRLNWFNRKKRCPSQNLTIGIPCCEHRY